MPARGVEQPVDIGIQEVIYAGLDAIQAVGPFDLCAYLHAAGDTGPQLFLAAPTLDTMTPSRAFDVFSALRDALEHSAPAVDGGGRARNVDLAGFFAVTVATSASQSRGLHAVGRLSTPLDDAERAVVARLCNALGAATNRLEAAAAGYRRPAEV